MKIEGAHPEVGQRGTRLNEKWPAGASLAGRNLLAAEAESTGKGERAAVAESTERKEHSQIEIIEDVEQGSAEWLELRRGIPTASRFSAVIACGREDGSPSSSKTRGDYMLELAGEILSGEIAEGFRSDAMGRGSEMEAEAREHYERTHLVEVRRVGFIRRTLKSGLVGCSPDGLIGARKALEIKTTRPSLLLKMHDKGAQGFPSEHKAQLQGTLWVADLDEIDLYVFYRNMKPAKFTMRRDEKFIRELADSVEFFNHELKALVERHR